MSAIFAEMSEWFKEHDWKSCVGLKLTGGSNPLLCAIKKHPSWVLFYFSNIEEDSRVGAVLREQNALPLLYLTLVSPHNSVNMRLRAKTGEYIRIFIAFYSCFYIIDLCASQRVLPPPEFF